MRCLWRLAVASGLLLLGCKDPCERAADTLSDKCGSGERDDSNEAVEETCDADRELLSQCINDNDDKDCAQIIEICYSRR